MVSNIVNINGVYMDAVNDGYGLEMTYRGNGYQILAWDGDEGWSEEIFREICFDFEDAMHLFAIKFNELEMYK